MEHSREQWENFGILETVPEKHKDNATRMLNLALMHYLRKEAKEDKQRPFETIGFPILIKIIQEVNLSDAEALEILKELPSALKKFNDHQFDGYPVNIEFEFAYLYCEDKIEQLKNTF